VTRKDIVRMISEELGLSQLQTGQIVQKTFDAIVNILVENGRVELRNFGVLEVRWQNARQGRNPRTGEKVMVSERCSVTFKPGRALAERVRANGQTTAVGCKTCPKRSKAESSLGVDTARSGD
jgi:integration host factor subunit beta